MVVLSIIRRIYTACKDSRNPVLSSAYIAAMNIHCGGRQFISVQDLITTTLEMTKKIHSDFDVVVAIPRSGIFPGEIIANILGKPLSTPDLYAENRIWKSWQWDIHHIDPYHYNRISLIDESGSHLSQVQAAVNLIRSKHPSVDIKTAIVYLSDIAKTKVDYYGKLYADLTSIPRFDTHLMNADEDCGGSAFDMDGVLCEDWDRKRDYQDFLANARPYRIPIYPIKCIVTGRKEKYRSITENWLEKYNVKYRALHMLPEDEHDHIRFKSRILLQEKPFRFIESNDTIARECYIHTGVKSIALDTGKMYGGLI